MSWLKKKTCCFGFERLYAWGEWVYQASHCDLSFKCLLGSLNNFKKYIVDAPINKILQESLLQVCADMNMEEDVDEIIFPNLDKV